MSTPEYFASCPSCKEPKVRECAEPGDDCVHCDACGWCGHVSAVKTLAPWARPQVAPIDAADMWLDAHRTRGGGFGPVAMDEFEELLRLAEAALMAVPQAVTASTERTLRELSEAVGCAVNGYADRADLTDAEWNAFKPRWRSANQLCVRLTSVAVAIESIVRHIAS